MPTGEEKVHIERAISRARDGVGERIDELDRRLRTQFDIRPVMSAHAPELVAAGAVVGFLVGFGFPKLLRRTIALGIPLALIAMKVRSARSAARAPYAQPDYEI